jgi:hypothetical protein
MKIETAMKYPNARIVRYGEEMPFKKCSDYENILSLIVENVHHAYNYGEILKDNVKLQLRQLSSLTDAEKEYIHDNFIVKGLSTVRIYETLESMLNHCYADTKHKLIDYLRSISIDIDNLIESGEAENE